MLKRTMDGASPGTEHRLDLVHAAMRSTLVDLARLGHADLAALILGRGRPRRARRPRRGARHGSRHRTTTDLLDEPARR
jgi:hypothetical protein